MITVVIAVIVRFFFLRVAAVQFALHCLYIYGPHSTVIYKGSLSQSRQCVETPNGMGVGRAMGRN